MLKNDAKGRESIVKPVEMVKELGFGIKYMGILGVRVVYNLSSSSERTPTVVGSDGTSPWRLRTMSTSCIASNTG